ncbi:C2H2-like zinc finger protein [Striga hermonthica]|uniref:C2H2-like zinc finger protein n=1 Tax=Striga hermonthica TaxID=68872 RepID=A0A9N7NPN8_STRHE|nr:C2H2-like zinc finger protein [Striga hermonthica]
MPATELCSSGTLDAMKSDKGNDSLDTFIRQAIGKEPLIPFPRAADSSMQWIQLLNALDQPDLPGWPLMTPVKPQMQKCGKCSREFCSLINYRRHVREHRRSLNVHKDSHKNRDLLAAFWDKISLEQAKEVVLFDDVMLKDIPGSSIIRALASSVRKPGIWTLPPIYVRAGTNLLVRRHHLFIELAPCFISSVHFFTYSSFFFFFQSQDIIQAKPLGVGLPISSGELFSILDDASEKTFLCGGTAESVLKFVFDGETAKNCLELKNLVACTSFLFEQQLVKAWIAYKDAEALRCQKLLVEEEEAAQKRQAALLEKKKQKKLRQKAKEQLNGSGQTVNINVDVVDIADEASGPSSPSDTNSNSPPDLPANSDSSLESTQLQTKESNEENTEQQFVDNKHDEDSQTIKADPDDTCHSSTKPWQASKSLRGSRFGLNHQPLKSEPMHKFGPSRDRSLQNGTKIWTKKLKVNTDVEKPEPPAAQEKNNCEVIIGSIAVTLKSFVAQPQKDNHSNKVSDKSNNEHAVLPKKNVPEKLTKAHHVQPGNNRAGPKHWRPVRHVEAETTPSLNRGNEDTEKVDTSKKVADQVLSGERSEESHLVDNDFENGKMLFREVSGEVYASQGPLPFSTAAAREFLAQRWKEAISSDHVTLELSEPKRPKPSDVQPESSTTTVPDASDTPVNQLDTNIQAKPSKKRGKGGKTRYIVKQKADA